MAGKGFSLFAVDGDMLVLCLFTIHRFYDDAHFPPLLRESRSDDRQRSSHHQYVLCGSENNVEEELKYYHAFMRETLKDINREHDALAIDETFGLESEKFDRSHRDSLDFVMEVHDEPLGKLSDMSATASSVQVCHLMSIVVPVDQGLSLCVSRYANV